MHRKRRMLALITAIVMVLAVIPGISFAAQMSAEMQEAYDALVIPNENDIRVNLSLPDEGKNGASVVWKSSDETVVSTTEKDNPGYFSAPAGIVTRGAEDVKVTLTAEITLGDEKAQKVFELTVKALPNEVSVMDTEEENTDKYLFYYFKGDRNGDERIWLAGSDDGLKWKEMNDGQPIISSTMGTYGLRDPYIIRSHEGDKFFLIATDLKISSTNWSDAQYKGSKSIMIWESTDLVNWSEQRMVEVSIRPEQGCTWAPEAAYDEKTGQYVVFWSSKNINNDLGRNAMQTVYYATTPDFYTFSEPEVFITYNSANPDEPINVIDTTILQADDGKYYRLTKHEGISRIFIESSEYLLKDYGPIEGSNLYTDFSGVEGPEIYRLKDGRYCAILDNFGGIGYFPVVTDNLAEGKFTQLASNEYDFSISPRHGGVIQVSAEEYAKVVEKYGTDAVVVEPDEDGSEPIIKYSFDDETAADSSGNGYDGVLYGNAKVTDSVRRGKVLSLDGTSNTYLEIPKGVLDGRNRLTVSMDVMNNTTGNYFTFALGKDSARYFFTKMKNNGLKGAITTTSYSHEDVAENGDMSDLNGQWKNATVTISESTMKVYINGVLVAENTNLNNTVANLGRDTLAYIGKSFYSGDAYANMLVDNIHIYNRVLSDEEILEKYDLTNEERTRYSVEINADEKGADITEGMFGLFFEDINYAGDGGLYSEVINNRSFEAYRAEETNNAPPLEAFYAIPGYGWSSVGDSTLEYLSENPLNSNNTTYLRLTAKAAGDGVLNDCYSFTGENANIGENYAEYSGFNAVSGKKFNGSFYARGNYDGKITIEIVDTDNNVIGSGSVEGITDEFKKYEFTVTATGTCKNARVRVVLEKEGTVDLDMISVLPQETFNGRDNGLRYDLVEKLAALRPGFLRFPGGCIIEGYDISNRYQWKQSVGPVEQRVQNWNRWQTHNENHEGNGMYGYCQTYGLGFYEYFLLCEDIGAKAVPVVSVGIGCQYQTGDYSSWEDLYGIFIPDALDLIEFANGETDENWQEMTLDMTDESSFNGNWANVRAVMGHPASFALEYIGIGNEQINTNENRFFERYEAFEQAIHEKYPDMKLISTSGPEPEDVDKAPAYDAFTKSWNWLAEHNGDENFTYAVDEHYYKDPNWFYNNVNRYDGYDRNGFSVFAGEYASRWWSNYPRGNTLETSLAEAAYMTALERNSDVVKLASYAPLFARLGGTQWTPDMIWFTSDNSYGSADYYVQQLFSRNSGNYNLLSKVSDRYEERSFSGKGYAGVGTWLTSAQFKDYTVTDNETGEVLSVADWQTENDGLLKPNGDWAIDENSVVSETSTSVSGAVLFSGDMIESENYTITVKATKTGGDEGFLVPFMATDSDNYYFWNIGGWSNKMSAFQQHVNGSNNNVVLSAYNHNALETGREYEIKIVYNHGVVQGFIDNKLMNSYNIYGDKGPVYESAIYDEETGDIIVKLVNSSDLERRIPVSINYSGKLTGFATEYMLQGEELTDKNTVNDMEKLVTVKNEIDGISSEFTYEMPKYSVAVLRIHTGDTKAVAAVEELNITTGSDFYPALPETVNVTLADGATEERAVAWILPNSGIYANEGSFKVYGKIAGSEVDAVANVTVESGIDYDVIDVDMEKLVSGDAAEVVFNPGVYGKYSGIVAVYNDGKLESFKRIVFEGDNYAIALKLKNVSGKTVKVMLWTEDEIKPVATAVETDAAAGVSVLDSEEAVAVIEIAE